MQSPELDSRKCPNLEIPEFADERASRTRRVAQAGGGLAILLLLLHAGSTLLATPCLGVADILDFWRVMLPAGIEHVSPLEHPGYYVRCEFRTFEAALSTAPSSSAFLAWAAKQLPWRPQSAEGRMDLRQVGLLYLLLVIAIVATALARGAGTVFVGGLLWVFVDPGYLLFLNSFYADAAMLVAILGIVLWFRKEGRPGKGLARTSSIDFAVAIAGIVLLALLGGGSKMQFAALPIVLALSIFGLPAAFSRAAARRAIAVALLLTLVGCLTLWNFFLGAGPRFPEHNNYHAVFGGILRVTSHPEKVLGELGVPRQHFDLPRTDSWTAGVGLDHPVHQSLRGLSRLTLLRQYLVDPAAMGATLAEISRTLALVPSHPRGTRVRDVEDRRPVKRTHEVPWQFSRISRAALGLWPPITWLVLVGAAAWLGARSFAGDRGPASAAVLFLLLWITSQCAIAVLGEGLVNLHQHLVGARFGFDLLLVFLVADLVRVAFGARGRRPKAIPPGPLPSAERGKA